MIDTRFAPHAALLLRLGLGTMWISHALLKVFVFTLPGTVAFFESVGFWGPLAYVVIAAELVRAHGGEIKLVEGTIGATFRLTIPDRAVELDAHRSARARA